MEYFITFKILKEGAIPLLTWEDLLRHSQGGKKDVLRTVRII